ncbi:MAG TPA: hypothetical protein VHE77_05525 [Dongiaceae bacterium]|jgi:hypothetical protein|nr:hypothetical protein [Dongiaceae bacterium]
MAQAASDFDVLRDDIAALKKQMADLVRHGAAAARHQAEDMKDLPERGAETLREQVRESPIASIAIAFIAGSIVARLLR